MSPKTASIEVKVRDLPEVKRALKASYDALVAWQRNAQSASWLVPEMLELESALRVFRGVLETGDDT